MEYHYPKFTPEMKKTHTILIPNMAVTQFRLMEYALRCEGYKCELLGNCGSAVAQLGLKYVHNDTCYPALLVIGLVLGGSLHPQSAAGIPVLLILVIQGSIWINYGIPTITNSPLFFLSYLVVSSIQMGANIDYAIVTTSRFMEFKDKMPKKDAIIETMNMSFPTIITSGLMMAIAGILIGQMTSNAAIAGIGDSLGRGTIITIFIVMFILPQILLLGEKVIDKTAFDMPSAVSSHQSSGRVRIDGMVRGEIHGQISGVVHAVVEGDVNISLLSGTAEPETPPEEPGTPEVPVTAEEEDAEHE